ncbi:MAG: hypothetical protein ABR518_04495, partial [Actinomycetota bacterium]
MDVARRDSAIGLNGAGLAIVLGGIGALVGALLAWIQIGAPGLTRRFGGGGSLNVQGTDLLAGKVTLGAGIALILLGVGMWFVRGGSARRWLSVLAVVAGGVAVGATVAAFHKEGLGLASQILGSLPRRGGGLGRFR